MKKLSIKKSSNKFRNWRGFSRDKKRNLVLLQTIKKERDSSDFLGEREENESRNLCRKRKRKKKKKAKEEKKETRKK